MNIINIHVNRKEREEQPNKPGTLMVVRGAQGSGKTTFVNGVLEQYGKRNPATFKGLDQMEAYIARFGFGHVFDAVIVDGGDDLDFQPMRALSLLHPQALFILVITV